MKLNTARVTNFRSVEDSGEFTLDQVLCLVGKNEAGKTAIVQAIAGLNPHPSTPITFDKERDYPRRFLTDYAARHEGEEAVVISTTWTLDSTEKEAIGELIGSALTGDLVTITRSYGATKPSWSFSIDFPKAIEHLVHEERMNASEKAPLAGARDTKSLRAALEGISAPTAKHTKLLERINSFHGRTITGAIEQILTPGFPRFMYFSHYDRMDGQIRLDTFKARKAGQQQPAVESGEQVFIDFLEYAGTSVDEISTATTYEGLNARCEAASNSITAQLLEYWTQNPDLEIEVRVTKAETNDKPPFNQGIIARARVKNNLHKVSVPFSERSAGFIWFFSFLVKFAQVQKGGGSLILLLDEPGLTLHGKAQADLLRYFEEKLAPKHQVIFTTHSPFMVPSNNLPSVRIVEDQIISPKPGQRVPNGTKVRSDSLATDRDTLFPLQGALGYELTQTLFIGKDTLLVEGPGDILYLQGWSNALLKKGKKGLDPRWTICPAGGLDKIQPFVSLFSGAKLNIAALTDYAKADKRKLESLQQNKILEGGRLLTFASLLAIEEGDVEDVFSPELFADIVNQAFDLPLDHQANAETLTAADESTTRMVKKAEAFFRVMPPELPLFDHFTPAAWMFQHLDILDSTDEKVTSTLSRAEKVIAALNKLLPLDDAE
jgi:energy-coupling factor transporter ATP-binding protein EcfA2